MRGFSKNVVKMNEFTTEAFSVICRNEDVFEFTQEYGLHGVAICNTEDPAGNWFNPKLGHSLGYSDAETLSWKKIISPGDMEKIEKIFDANNYSGEILSGEINFLHSKGFSIPMLYKVVYIEHNAVIALKKVSDYSHIKINPELDFQREQLLDTILDTINVGVIACDSKGKLTLFNKTAKKWHGLPAENIPQTEFASYYNLYEPDGRTLFRTEDIPLISILQEGVIRKNEMIIKAKTGSKRFVVINGARLYDERKNISGAVVALYDITERKEAEEKLRISEETFKGTFEHAANGMATADLSGKWMEVNDRFCEMLGYSREELKNKTFKDITHPEDINSSLIYFHEMLKGQREYFQAEKRHIHKNGNVINIILSVSVIKDADSKPLRFVAQITDITLLKEAEEKLRISEETFRGSFESAADGMAITDATGTCIEVNDRLSEIMGYSASELKTLNFQEVTYPEDLEEDFKLWSELLSGERDYYQMEKRAIHKSGRIKHIIVSVAIVRDENNDPFHFITQIIDISSLKEAREELRSTLSQLENLLEASTQVSIIGLDKDGLISTFNRGAENLLGYRREEALGKMLFSDLHLEKEIQQNTLQLSETYGRKFSEEDIFKLLEEKGRAYTREWNYLCKDGAELPVQLTITPSMKIRFLPDIFV